MTKLSNERMAELSAALRAKGRLPVRPGVLLLNESRVICAYQGGCRYVGGNDWSSMSNVSRLANIGIDFNDPATIGVLAGYARELWGDGGLHLQPSMHTLIDGTVRRDFVLCNGEAEPVLPYLFGDTRAEAWVAAILSAPERGEL